MGWTEIGGRQTFVPPFVNERFDGPPYWACTYTAGLLGANVAKLGRIPATHAEIAALARQSGDTTLRSGSGTGQLATALRARYGLVLRQEDVSYAECRRRLATGWALIAGLTYGKLPTSYRRWSPSFVGGHRALLVGFSGGRTRLIDPLASAPATYEGEWIEWSVFERAFWLDDQAWVLEGELMQQVITVLERFSPPRVLKVHAGPVQGWLPTGPGKKVTFSSPSSALFDAVVHIGQQPDPRLAPHGTGFIRVTNGVFAGQYLFPDGTAVTAVTTPDVPPAPEPVDVEAIKLAAKREEYDRIAGEAKPVVSVSLPARP